jgi:sulfur relay (sulfurtransferase) DsrF/TusC family protein
MGHSISFIRKQEEILAQDISTITKMAKYYDLDKSLVEKAKNYLISKKIELNDLTVEE